MKNKIIYHEADLDGHTSAAILLLNNSMFDDTADLIIIAYPKKVEHYE